MNFGKKLAAVICCPWKLYFDELLFSCAYTDSHETGKFRIIRNLHTAGTRMALVVGSVSLFFLYLP